MSVVAETAGATGATAGDRVEMVSLNTTSLRSGKLLDDISGVFGANAFLSLDEASGATVGNQLRDALGLNLTRVIDLFREWDENGDVCTTTPEGSTVVSKTQVPAQPHTRNASLSLWQGIVSEKEFCRALPLLGLTVDSAAANRLFRSFDAE